MADYNRPKEGFRFVDGGLKTNAQPDSIPVTKYNILQNVRAITGTSFRTRPGLVQKFTTGVPPSQFQVLDLKAYTTLTTDNLPRFLAYCINGSVYLDNGVTVGTLGLAAPAPPGVAMIPFRPNQSPNPWMYIANGINYQKFSAPTASNAVTQQAVGIAEPQTPPDAGVSTEFVSYMAEPTGGSYSTGGNASGFSLGARLTDKVQAAFPDPMGNGMVTLQVAGGSSLAAGIYLEGSVLVYLWPRLSTEQGAFGRYYQLATGSAVATASGNSLLFNPPQYNGTTDPNVQPMEWAVISATGAITGYNPLPTDGGQVGNNNYDMVVLATLFIPVPGTYTLNINHDDGMIFAIQGATLVSGPFSDGSFNHVQTAVNGYSFAAGSAHVLGGTNASGNNNETFSINFPTAGAYSMEIDYSSWQNAQQLCVLSNGQTIFAASGINAYQTGMVINVASQTIRVQDVFAPLPAAIAIAGIYYFSGTTGKCVIVPAQLGSGPGIDGASLYSEAWVASLRRGALVQVGSEVCYVLDVETGPNGTVCFTTTTVNAHTTADSLRGVSAIQVLGGTIAAGSAITSPDATFSTTTAGSAPYISTNTFLQSVNPFSLSQPDDLIHVSINVDNLANLNELKLLFDVGDGSFTQNFYYYAIRPNDIALGVSNGLTQLGVAQLVAQRAAIDDEEAAENNNQGNTSSSAQSVVGSQQWSEITFAINEMTRVGNDQTKTLQNLNSVQLLVNGSGVLNIQWNSVVTYGGYDADVGQSGAPYLYRVVPRSSVTGAKGNASPPTRYGVNPRRQRVTVYLPSASYDSQIDTWDVHRYGGTVTSWQLIGSTPSSNATFVDNYSDDSIQGAMETDNYQPWPTVDVPLGATASVCGTTAVVTITNAVQQANVVRYLPGNIVRIGGSNFYTLFTRPTQLTTNTFLFQFVENAGAGTSQAIYIYEPDMAQQRLPYMFGPDVDGTFFAMGDPLRPGVIYESKNNNPDSAPDSYSQEIAPPTEPLIGGELLNGTPYAASTERWWRGYPGQGVEHYAWQQQPIDRGLAAPYGHCTDGEAIYFWAKDSIRSTKTGSLTDDDLYNLFPHDGVPGVSVTYNGVTFYPPDYSRAAGFRLEFKNGYLYATYMATSGLYYCLVCFVATKAWHSDVYAQQITTVYAPEQPTGTLRESQTGTTLYPALLMGTASNGVCQQQDATNDLTTPISCIVATAEWDGGDVRAGMQWGDLWLDCVPASAAGIVAQPMSLGVPLLTPTTVPQSTSRTQSPISLFGGTLADYLGMQLSWTDNFASQSAATRLHIWQPSFLIKPETILDRFSDWYSANNEDDSNPNAWWQGFILHADTGNQVKGLSVAYLTEAGVYSFGNFTPAVQHNGEQVKAYSFTTPFIAHQVRLQPSEDGVPWRFFDVEWITQPTPEYAQTWQTQATSFGFNGYSHIPRIVMAYAAYTPITLTITSQDGQSPQPIVLPATPAGSGSFNQVVKTLFVLTPNKGQLFTFRAVSTAGFQIYLDDCEIQVGNWARMDGYLNYKSLGGPRGDKAEI